MKVVLNVVIVGGKEIEAWVFQEGECDGISKGGGGGLVICIEEREIGVTQECRHCERAQERAGIEREGAWKAYRVCSSYGGDEEK